jgi:acyl-CoA synthetase (NDP forming)
VLLGDFDGAVHPIDPSGASVSGVRSYPTVAEVPGPVDLAVVCSPADAAVAAAEAALDAGVRAICVVSEGFAESGQAGAARQRRLLELVRAHGARLIGPNGFGLAVAGPRLDATVARHGMMPGPIGFSSQSGAIGAAVVRAASARGLGFSALVSVGNKADVSSNDLLEWWADDPRTELILLYLESFGNPRKFGRLARRVSRRKPILALKSGGSRAGARAASSHTAAFAGSEIAVEALFRQAGVLRARTLEEMLDVAALLASQPLPAGQRVGVLTNAGGFGILCADACESAGLELPAPTAETRRRLASILPPEASVENPIDLQGAAGPEAYQRALPILLADPRLDAVIVLHASPLPERAEAVAAALLRAVPARGAKPVLACLVGSEPAPAPLTQGRIPRFSYPEAAARALGLAAERSAWLRRPAGSIPALEGADRAAAKAIVAGPPRWLEPAEVKALLAAYAIRFAEERAEGAVELIAGLVQDPVFGPLVAFGRRGAMSARLAPLTDVDAAELVAAGELGAALEPLDRGALTELAHRLSRLGDEIPEVAELELSPIVAGPAGCAGVQARARVAAPEPRLGRKTW